MEHISQINKEIFKSYFIQILQNSKFNYIYTLKIEDIFTTFDTSRRWIIYIDTSNVLDMTWQASIHINSIDQIEILIDWLPKQQLSLKDPNFSNKLKNIIDESLSHHIKECKEVSKYEPRSDITDYYRRP